MFGVQTLMRRALLAALLLVPSPALAGIAVHLDEASGTVVVTGLEPDALSAALSAPETVRLRLETSASERGMLVTLGTQDGALVLVPRFALKLGAKYELDVASDTFTLVLPQPQAPVPRLAGFAPSQAVIPANTLRLYLHFSEPMARGQLRHTVSLVTADGDAVASPFLSLEAELWDPTQTRATLLLDPGRIKQGVGPNVTGGAPLEEGQNYHLRISPEMESAAGVPLGKSMSVAFRVGPPERRAIVPEVWQVLPPEAKSLAPFSIGFDRIMDSGAVRRLIELRDPQGQLIPGEITTDGGGWSLIPEQPWQAGRYSVVVDPKMEDVAGNSIRAPFDASPGTIGADENPVIQTIDVTAR